jgi:hypothetical protein
VTEPYTDVPAMAIAVVGIIVFGYLVMMAYSSYAEGAYYAAMKDDVRTIATSVASDGAIAADGSPGLLDASKLDAARDNGLALNYGYGNSIVSVTVACKVADAQKDVKDVSWSFGKNPRGDGHSIYYRMPVTVKLNEARSVPGTLTVIVTEA